MSQAVEARRSASLAPLDTDPIMAELIRRHGPAPLGSRDPFVALVRAIVSQQLSTRAARAILERLSHRTGLEPRRIARARVTTLRAAGLSRAKAATLREVARATRSGALEDLTALDDIEVAERLTAIKGVGVWTAEMVLIFGLGRPDVWPIGDLGIRRAARRLYRIRSVNGMIRLGRRFRPLRSHAAWYLWRVLEDT